MKFLALVSLLALFLLPTPTATWTLVHCSARSYCTYLDPKSKYCRTTKLRDEECHSLENDHDDAKRDGARSYLVLDWGDCTNVSFYWNNDCTHQWMNYTQQTLKGCEMRTRVVRSFRFSNCHGDVNGGKGKEKDGFLAQIVCQDGVCRLNPKDQPGPSQAEMLPNDRTVTTL